MNKLELLFEDLNLSKAPSSLPIQKPESLLEVSGRQSLQVCFDENLLVIYAYLLRRSTNWDSKRVLYDRIKEEVRGSDSLKRYPDDPPAMPAICQCGNRHNNELRAGRGYYASHCNSCRGKQHSTLSNWGYATQSINPFWSEYALAWSMELYVKSLELKHRTVE